MRANRILALASVTLFALSAAAADPPTRAEYKKVMRGEGTIDPLQPPLPL